MSCAGWICNGAYHARQAVELNAEDIELWEWLLFFHDIPDKLVSHEEAEVIAKKALEVKPDSDPAKKTLDFDTCFHNKRGNNQ